MIITVLRGESANLLSVGAIDLGIIVDGTVIMVENIFRHLAHYDPSRGRPTRDRSASATSCSGSSHGAVEVDKPIFFSVIDHHRGVPAAVHHAGRGRPDLRRRWRGPMPMR